MLSFIKNPANMLKNTILSIRIWKQNLNIFFRSFLILIWKLYIFFKFFGKKLDLCWRQQKFDDVIKNFFYKIVHLVIVYLHTNFYGNWASFTEVMEGGHFEPPQSYGAPKSPVQIGLKYFYSNYGKCYIYDAYDDY